ETLCKAYEPGWFTPTILLLDRAKGDITAFRAAEENALNGLQKDPQVAEARGLATLWRNIPSNAQGQEFIDLTADLDKHNLIISGDKRHSQSLIFIATRDDPQSFQARKWVENLSERIKTSYFSELPTRVLTGGFLAMTIDIDRVLLESL